MGPPRLAFNRFLPNPGLRPQDGKTLEAGAGFDFKNVAMGGDRLTLKGFYWETDAKNFIDLNVVANGCSFAPFPPFNQATCFSQFVNRDVDLKGVEIELKYDAPRFYGGISYATIDGKEKGTGLFLGSLQPDKIVVDAGVKLPEYRTRLGTRVTFADDFTKVNDPSLKIDGYDRIDVYAAIEPKDGPLKGFRLDLGVDNITDEAYAVGAPTFYKEGINYKGALTWTKKW